MPSNLPMDITQPQLDLVIGLVAGRLPGATIVAFGSRVRNWPYGHGSKPYSDLDLAVWPTRPDTPGKSTIDLALAELRADLEDSALPWRVDVTLAQDLPASLRQLVRQHGIELLRAAEHST